MHDVEESVEPKEQNDVGCDVFDVLASSDHVKLRQDGAGLEPDGERPKNAIK